MNQSPQNQPAVGKQFGRLRLLCELGRGGFGTVWHVQDGYNQYAAKFLPKSASQTNELLREATIWLQLPSHANVLPFRGVAQHDDWVILLSHYAPGGSLANWMQKRPSPAPVHRTLQLIAGILEGVRHLHEHSPPVIHCDLKPQNVLLDELVPLIADFGLARFSPQESQPHAGLGAGTRSYMAPETRNNRRDQRTDLWAIGIIFCELLTQRHPFPTRSADGLRETANGPDTEVMDKIPSDVRCLVLRAIDPDRVSRYQSAEEMLADVLNLQSVYPPPAEEPTAPRPPDPQPPSPVRSVPMRELGPFLEYYANLLGLEPREVATRFCDWSGESVQWPADLYEPEEVAEFLTTRLYRGSAEDVPLAHLSRLLGAFPDASNSADVPRLMAEWLCAEVVSDKPFIQLPFTEFESPSADLGRTYGTRSGYQNARYRLPGMGCAFVHFELQANTKSPEAVTTSGEPYTRVTELLRHLHETETIEHPIHGVPHSRSHVHPGDELIYVLEGTIFVELDNTGLWTPVLAGDYIHFNAEIPHAVWNVSADQPAKAVIIRFFQLSRQGTRNGQVATLREIQELMGGMGQPVTALPSGTNTFQQMRGGFAKWSAYTENSYYLWTAIAPWVHDRTRPPQGKLKEADESNQVQDLVGLSQFLRAYVENLCDGFPNPALLDLRGAYRAFSRAAHDRAAHAPAPVPGSLPENTNRPSDPISCLFELNRQIEQFIATNAPERREQWRTCFHGIPRGSKHVPTAEDLEQLALKLSLPPVLLQGYLSPNALRVVVVRGAKTPLQGARDWVKAPYGAAGGVGRRASYLLPSRSLANSDLSIVLLTLPRDSSTSWNAHPGFELILPITGEVCVSFFEQREDQRFVIPSETTQSTMTTPSCGTDTLTVYKSDVFHRVKNSGSTEARSLVIRFNIPANIPNSAE